MMDRLTRSRPQRPSRHRAAWLALALLLSSAAAAEDCPDLADRLSSAQAAFDDAELSAAGALLTAALDELACQTRPLDADELGQLFETAALVRLADGDEPGAVYAVIRGVVADPSRIPNPSSGPLLSELYDTWSRRLGAATTTLAVREGALRVDGRPYRAGDTLDLLEGEHIFQWQAFGRWRTEVRELRGTNVWPPGADLPEPEEPEPAITSRRRTRPAIWGTGLGVAALGGAALGVGWHTQGRFLANPYDRETYRGCTFPEACWTEARTAQINADATAIRATYVAGYSLLTAGVVLTGVGLALSPAPGGAHLALSAPLPTRAAKRRGPARPHPGPR